MAVDYDATTDQIISLVGGTDNINNVTHCVTRLRFTLKDIDLADAHADAIAKLPGVIKVLKAGGQFQVVIGNQVEEAYDLVVAKTGLAGGTVDDPAAAAEDGQSALDVFMNTISGILVPTLAMLTAAGIVKGIVSFLALENIGLLDPTSGLYMVLYALGDGFFYFLPIFLGFSAARKFGCNEYVGAAIGAALVYPSMVNIASTMEVAGTLFAGTAFEMSYFNTFLGIPIVMPGAGYTSSVFPVILAVLLASRLEKWCKKTITPNLRGILTPIITSVVSVVCTYLVIGPVLNAICGVISIVVNALFNIPVVGGVVAGALLGGGFGVLVMFGLHWVIIGMALQFIAQNGFDYMMACGGIGPMVGMFQGLAICWACRKNLAVRDLAIPATISQICGVGEPLMYSTLIPIKKLFAINILGGCVGGAIIGVLGTKMYMFGGSGLFGIFNYAGGGGMQDVVKYCIGVGVAGIFTMVATIMAYNDEEATRILG